MRSTGWIKNFRYAFDGIMYCVVSQWSMRIHVAAAILALAMAFYFQLPGKDFLVLSLTIAGVMVVEMLNTAIETVVDMVSPDFHPLAKIAKDVAAGAVLIMAGVSLIVAYLLFFHRLFG